MNTLLMSIEVIPKHIRILQIRLRIPLLRMDQQREQRRISDEKHGRVVEDPVPISFFREELHAETAGIARCVCGPLFAAHGGETGYEGRGLADAGEDVGVALGGVSLALSFTGGGMFGME